MEVLRKLIVYFFSFKGRVKRIEWWICRLGAFFALALLIVLIGWLLGLETTADIFLVIFIIPFWWLQLSFSIRRLHDTDRSGWCVLLFLIPLYAFIVCGCLKGTEGENKYG